MLLTACHVEPLCSSDVLQVVRETGTDRYAVAEVRNCGATTEFLLRSSTLVMQAAQRAAQEVFVADSNRGTAAAGIGDAIWINAAWVGRGRLHVAYASGARVFKTLPFARGVAISYRATDPIRQ